MNTISKCCLISMIAFILAIQLTAQPTDSIKIKNLKIARSIIANSKQCALITLAENGQPQVRTMDPFEPEDDFTIWLGTNPKSRKVRQIKKNNKVALYYSDHDNGYVSVYGVAELVNDHVEKEKHWKQEWSAYYPNRTDSYLLIKVIPDRVEIISYKDGISGNPNTWEPEIVLFKKH